MKAFSILLSIIGLCLPALGVSDSFDMRREAEEFFYKKAEDIRARDAAAAEKEEKELDSSMWGKTSADMFGNRDPMFTKDSAATTFASPSEMGASLQLGRFDETAGVRKKEREKEARAKAKAEKPTADEIAEKFGNPDEDPEIKADDKAPKAYKAMMAVMQSGDRDLAFRYARQYMRYVTKVKDTASTIDKMLAMAKQREGMAPALSPEDPGFDEDYRRLMGKDLERVREVDEDGIAHGELTPEVQALLDRAAAEEKKSDGKEDFYALSRKREIEFPTAFDPNFDEQKERARVRTQLAGKAPIDPKGQVRLILFVNPLSEKSMVMAREAQKLATQYEGRPGVTVELKVSRTMDPNDLQRLIAKEGFTVPVEANLQLAARLGVASYPAVVAVAPSSGKYLLEEGYRPGYYMDELLKAVQGFK